jgi:hypothetical protein
MPLQLLHRRRIPLVRLVDLGNRRADLGHDAGHLAYRWQSPAAITLTVIETDPAEALTLARNSATCGGSAVHPDL